MDILPKNLKQYFSQHLKVIATIGTEEEIEWAIFFGKPKESVGEFPGKVPDNLSTLTWEPERPLWLIPLSLPARSEAEKATKNSTVPKINYSTITIRNRGKNKDSWDTNYDFWYDNADKGSIDAWNSDSILILGKTEELVKLSNKGKWVTLEATGDKLDEAWPVWITTEKFETYERVITFPAPTCQIINDKGEYPSYELWFGVREYDLKDNIHKKLNRPFVNVSEGGTNDLTDGTDCSIVWREEKKRIDDLIELAHSDENSESLIDSWKFKSPLKLHKKLNTNPTAQPIVDKFNGSVTPFTSQWLISESITTGGLIKEYFRLIYFRNYSINEVDKSLFKKVGRPKKDKLQKVRTVQINYGEESKLLVKLSFIGDKELKLWNDKTVAVSQGLMQVEGSSPVGVTPQLNFSFGTDCEYIGVWSRSNEGANSADLAAFNLVETAFIKNDKIFSAEFKSATINFPCLQSQTYVLEDGDKPQGITLTNPTISFQVRNSHLNDNGTLFQLILSDYEIQKSVILRDGALAFTLTNTDKENPLPNRYGLFRLSLQFVKTQRPFFWWQWYTGLDDFVVESYAVEDFSLPVGRVEAAGQDVAITDKLVAPRSLGAVGAGFGERREPTLIIPLDTSPQTDLSIKPNFFLTFFESVNVGQNYRLDLRLQEYNPTVSPADGKASTHIQAVILDTNPQFMGLINARFLQQPGYDDGAWVVARRSPFSVEAGGWEILDDGASSEGFYLVLPAQAIGEAYVKTSGTPPSNEPSEPEQPIQYRFGAPAILRLAPTRLDRRYVAPSWDIPRIWGSPGDSSPGIPLLEAQFELLYGLMGYLKPENAFMAELASKLGDVPVPPNGSIAWVATNLQQSAFRKSWQRYLQFYRAWQSRLAILEPSLTDAFSSAVFDKNLTFGPRVKLESSDGLIWARTKGADLKEPVSLVPDERSANPSLENKIQAAHNETGLAGGFQYGFESKAIYTEFWREALDKGSSSAELKELAFSSTGGWGKQTARFANDRTIIKANVAMGRTHFYSVERIGRVGVFWHKAKHVIEYERTVVPSFQFRKQPPHLGRPLIRKVREYVEILEPKRNYPDFVTETLDTPGSVTSCFFKSLIIPVQSSWGHDVRDGKGNLIGWEVPLWKPGANQRNHPKPQVQFTLLPPHDSDERDIFCNLSKPHNLWFYTDTRNEAQIVDGTSIDVHAWPPILNVDYTNLPEPEQYDIEPSAGTDSKSVSLPLPKAIDIFPGFERFTFRIDRHEIPASVAGRYYPNSGISGRLRTVSMMRSSPDKTIAKTWWSNLNGSAKQQAAKDALASLVADNKSLLAKSANGFFGNLTLKGDLSEDSLKSWIKDQLTQSLSDSKLNTLWKLSSSVEKPKLQYFDDLWETPNRFSYPTKWLWREALESAEAFVNIIHNSYEKQRELVIKNLTGILTTADYSIGDVISYLALFKDRLLDSYFDVDFTVDSAFSFISETANSSINLLIKNIDELLNELIDILNKINTNKILDDTEINSINKKVNYAIDTIKACCNHLLNLLSEVKEWDAEVNKISDEINKILDVCKDNLTKLVKKLSEATQNAKDTLNDIKLSLFDYDKDIKQELNLLRNEISFFIDTERENLKKVLDDLNEIIRKLRTDISQKVDAFISDVEENWTEIAKSVAVQLNTKLDETWNAILELVKPPLKIILYDGKPGIFSILQDLDNDIKALENVVKSSLLNIFGDSTQLDTNINDWLETLTAYQRLKEAINNKDKDTILNASVALADSINDDFGRLAGEVAQKVREFETVTDAAQDIVQVGKQTLSNFRSVWEEFTAPGMGLNRKTVALLVNTDLKDVEQRVLLTLTPSISQVKQFGKQLEELGLHLPVAAITDRLLPAKPDWVDDLEKTSKSALSNFDVSTLFSDIGGIRLDGLFDGVKMDDSMRDKIIVTHGFDKQNLMAWVNAEVKDLSFNETLTLVSIGALNLRLEKAKFNATIRLEGDFDGKVKKTNEGELKGSWAIMVNDTVLMTFRDSKVIFKNDKLSFDLDPKRMEMSGLLQMLTQATQTLMATGAVSNSDSEGNTVDVFKVGLTQVGTVPTGIMAQLNIPPISVGGGTTAITNLSFGGFFLLSFLDEDLKFKFKMGLGFYLGKKEAPFNITIFILGGGGYVDCALYLEPGLFGQKKGLTVNFSMSLLVSAALAVNAGWIKGGVAIMLGLELDYHRQSQADSDNKVSFSIYIYVVGQVDILNIVSVFLSLLLQATYEQGSLKGTGQVVLTIRICRFFKINVNKTYTKVFTGSKTQKTQEMPEARFVALEGGQNPVVAPKNENDIKAKAIIASLA